MPARDRVPFRRELGDDGEQSTGGPRAGATLTTHANTQNFVPGRLVVEIPVSALFDVHEWEGLIAPPAELHDLLQLAK